MGRPSPLAVLVSLLAGCHQPATDGDVYTDDHGGDTQDAGVDPAGDGDLDAPDGVDPWADAPVDGPLDVPADVTVDGGSDVEADVLDDRDAAGDEVEDLDAATDEGEEEIRPECTSLDTIESVRAMLPASHGETADVDLTLCGVLVTYVSGQGWYVQSDPAGPGAGVSTAVAPTVDVGDLVDLDVTRVDNFRGNLRIVGFDVRWAQPGHLAEALALVQDLSAGIVPGATLEHELVRVRGATLPEITDPHGMIVGYGTAADVLLRVEDAGPLCAGAAFDVLAVVEQLDGVYFIHSYEASDLSNVDTWWCGVPPLAGDLVLNEFLADPPVLLGDANCDGVLEPLQDEFVELVNVSTNRISLARVSIWDEVATRRMRHLFESWRTLAPGEPIVVFGGGIPGSMPGSPSGCIMWPASVQVTWANQPLNALGLNNVGDTIEVWYDESGAWATELVHHTYGEEGESDQSWTLSPDLTGAWSLHSTADVAGASPWSPGTRIDGSPF